MTHEWASDVDCTTSSLPFIVPTRTVLQSIILSSSGTYYFCIERKDTSGRGSPVKDVGHTFENGKEKKLEVVAWKLEARPGRLPVIFSIVFRPAVHASP